MKREVVLSILGRQQYEDQETEVIELVTEGVMEFRDGGWDIRYEESELTGLEGVTTTFRVEPEKIVLLREGRLRSEMVFQMGVVNDSLYQTEFGALMVTVEATQIFCDILPEGGRVNLAYRISIENSTSGEIDYQLDIRAKES